jgi:transcriptional regulator with XRE-family HTH domain
MRAFSLAVGREETYVRKFLKNRSQDPGAETLQRMAQVMGVPLETLTGGSDQVGATRLPGRSPGPAQRAEVLRVWDALDADRRKAVLLMVRAMAKDAGLPGSDAPLLLSGAKSTSEEPE